MITRERQTYDLKEAFFPVREESVYRDAFRAKKIPGYKALVNGNDNNVLSVVSDGYHLLLNAEAVKFADDIIRSVFSGSTLMDFECFNLYMPKSKASCRIDLILPNSYRRLFDMSNEEWIPFVRITNSYNRTTTLKYEIGFCRFICLNGAIFGKMSIQISINHSKYNFTSDVYRQIEEQKRRLGNIDSLWSLFEKKMTALKNISLPVSCALPIYCKVFDIKKGRETISPAQKQILYDKAQQIINAGKEYFSELGNNAYAMMNVLTDYASFPAWSTGTGNYVGGYQRKVGQWVDEFLVEAKKDDFSLSGYIGDEYQNAAYYLESLVQNP